MIKLTPPEDTRSMFTIRVEDNPKYNAFVAHIAPWHVCFVAASRTTLVITTPFGERTFPCESAEQAEQLAADIRDFVEETEHA